MLGGSWIKEKGYRSSVYSKSRSGEEGFAEGFVYWGTGKVLSERKVTLQPDFRCLVVQGTKQLKRASIPESGKTVMACRADPHGWPCWDLRRSGGSDKVSDDTGRERTPASGERSTPSLDLPQPAAT